MKEGSNWKVLDTLTDWEQNPSKKVDILVEGVKYHLHRDNRQPLKIENNLVGPVGVAASPVITPTPTRTPTLTPGSIQAQDLPDKVVIFSNFRSTLDLIENVSHSCLTFSV